MRKLLSTAAVAAACLALAACGDRDGNASADNGATTAASNASASAAGESFPKGARIVEENGVTYRVDPDGTRVELGPDGPRIVVEEGVRYRVDPGGNRVRIDETGVEIDVPDVDVDLPDVDVGINEKGNPDVDVRDDVDVDVNTSR